MAIIVMTVPGPLRASYGILSATRSVFPGESVAVFSQDTLNKLQPENNTGLGSNKVQGNVIPTRVNRSLLDVANTYLTSKLTADELALILAHRDRFDFTIGTGDRRPQADLVARFAIADNWRGEDAEGVVLTPDPYGPQPHRPTLTWSAAGGMLKLTDSHAGQNLYCSIRYFTIRMRRP